MMTNKNDAVAYSQKSKNLKKIAFWVLIKNLILNKYINRIYYYFKKKYVVDRFKDFSNKIKNKKIKKEINLILKFYMKRQSSQKEI